MQHSIAAKYAARPAARFVRPPARLRERRLGLRTAHAFIAAPSRGTVLRHPDLGLLTTLRASWRTLRVAPPRNPSTGVPRPSTGMLWTRSPRAGRPRRTSPAAAWRA